MFFVEARYHHSPKKAGGQVRYIAHREEGLRGGERRELYDIGERYRAFRGDEKVIRKALMDDGRGLRNPVYFRFILTVDNRAAERFARIDGRLAERILCATPWGRPSTGLPAASRAPSRCISTAGRTVWRIPTSMAS
jgi:hypothetical protein